LCPNTDNGTVSTSAVATVITKAEAEVNSLLGPNFSVPVATSIVADIVKLCACDIAVHFCYKRTTEFRDDQGNTPVQPDFVEAVKRLKELKSGERDMGDEAATSKSSTVGGVVYYSTNAFIVETAESTDGPSGGF